MNLFSIDWRLTKTPVTTANLRSKIKDLRWGQWFGIAGLAGLFIALRWNNFAAPLIRDEGDFAYCAQLLVQGIAPYQHAYLQKPPMVAYTYALCNLLLPHVFWSARLGAGCFMAVATALTGYIARLEFGKGFAMPVMWLMTPMVLLPGLEQYWASAEAFLLLPLLAAVAIYCHSRQHGNKPKYWFLAGFCAVTAILYKYTAFPVLAFVFAWWLVELCRAATDKNSIWRCLAGGLTGVVAAALLETGYFLLHDGGATLWECTVHFNRYYVASGPFGLSRFLFRLELFWDHWSILFFLPVFGLFLRNPRIWFWLGVTLAAFCATSMGLYGQYYIMPMPFLALLSAAGIHVLGTQLSKWLKPPPAMNGLLTAAVMVMLIRPDVPWMLFSPSQFADSIRGGAAQEFNLVADKVSQLSSPDDFVFVAGSEPEIYYYARRFCPTRFTLVYPLMIPGPDTRRYQQEAISDLERHPPALIVLAQAPDSWELRPDSPPEFYNFLYSLLLKNYELAGGYMKNGHDGRWLDQLNAGEIKDSDVLLYKLRAG